MKKFSLDALARKHLEEAAAGSAGRSSETFYGGHEQALRHTVIGLRQGATVSPHPNPVASTVVVLRGRVRLTAGSDAWEGRPVDLLAAPDTEHTIEALEDSALLLTVVMDT
ncbi:LuxR family transcriptional regulator [Streptomonospora nanhaiensis]|uniref:Quercetin dioxygenase-like cupin family protein n=1 Tax=Streptomonospora nanhaiensis TaxID=1323731 RepID=A0A853BVK3_9ACTN|nr:LuxR family transcriptional regulator [Streptomonospora nanhaiensis]MBV2364872.1 LuxR family transcriptional regulator [Streptomonospora nanhaiensis]MBX9387161.1 LuxR family transcriptional regulator [Streptomonospora nanhaiensis]NYI98816.1 quercetin dioxygenase-like cupin family protein [Streptomonospora nanhaiensis]